MARHKSNSSRGLFGIFGRKKRSAKKGYAKYVWMFLAFITGSVTQGEAVTNMWYDEVRDYSFPNGGFSMRTGHFTQSTCALASNAVAQAADCHPVGMQLMGMQLHTPIQDQAPLHNEICRPRQDYLLGKNQVTVKLTTMTIQIINSPHQ